MSHKEFNEFYEWSILDYSRSLINAGLCNEENGFDFAKKEIDLILPQGRDTEKSFIYVITNREKEDVGCIWYCTNFKDEGFICDFLILERFRRKGYGRQALLLLEDEVKSKKINRLRLNVFKFNKPALELYKSLGYKIFHEWSKNMHMVKDM